MSYEMVIGLETHVELLTKTKIFCGCSTAFGAEANTQCCPVCTGLPGSLPVLNRSVVEYAVKAGLATNCKIRNISKTDRKNYVYPDLCKAYQISQFDYPICYGGHITLSDGQVIRINRIHIEEDAGKLIHSADRILIDYNRGGVPLIEIVTEADFRSASQVKEYLEMLRLIMKTLNISDCKMQEGSLRCDVNISVRKKGEEGFGTKTELKNINSFTFITKAIEYEASRQVAVIESGGEVVCETRRYNSAKNITESMRSKEEAEDYRYFPEPDLPIIHITDEEIARLRSELPELPADKISRYIKEYKLSRDDASLIAKYPKLSVYFEEMIKESGGAENAVLCANILLTHIFKFMETEEAKENAKLSVDVKSVGYVIGMIASGEISNNFTKKIIDKMFEEGKIFDELFDKSEFKPLDDSEIIPIIEEVILENEKLVSDYKGGKEKVLSSLIGMVMKKTDGRANAEKVREFFSDKLK